MRVVGIMALALALGWLPAAGQAAGGGTVLHISSHLPTPAKVSIDGRPAVTAPGEGSVVAPIAAGDHVLKVTSAGGVSYEGRLTLRAAQLMRWHGRGYWCVNLLNNQLEPYSREECEEDVTDAG